MAKIIGLMPVRNESWCLGLTARVALQWVDELVILDHASTDRSIEIEIEVAAEYPGRVHLLRNEEPEWDEMRHRQSMLDHARRSGASHIAIIDADELVTANLASVIGKWVRRLHPGEILQMPLYNLRRGLGHYHASGIWAHRIVSVAFCDADKQAKWSGDRFHSREPIEQYRSDQPVTHGCGGVLHLWGASEARLEAKHALYKVTERLRWPDKPVSEIEALYSLAVHGRPGDRAEGWRYNLVPPAWWGSYSKWGEHLTTDAVPWQAGEVRNIVASYPAGAFDGLDLFGVA